MSHAQPSVVNAPGNLYCAFHKHANSKVQKPQSQLCFLLPSIIITITSNTPWNTETHKTDWNHDLLNLLKLFPNRSVKMIDGPQKMQCQKLSKMQNWMELCKELVVREHYPMGHIAELWKMLATHCSDEVQDIWSDIFAAFTSQYGSCWFMPWKLGWAPTVTTKFMGFNTLTPKND